ncbi:MAG: Holliday junction resolvase RuvX [Ruminococcaceae bacterium]|nr:Holliday junction resolvase RuvX [Oscillospiraceae bacterium]
MRILGIDYGDARVGIAVSDPLLMMAQGVKTLPNKVFDKMMDALDAIIKEYNTEKIVLGFPKNMDGSVGFRGEITLDFKQKLEEKYPHIQLILQDERLSTMMADRFLSVTNTRGENRKKVIDTVSAEVILQSYLDSIKK